VNPRADTDPVTDSGASGTSAAHAASACAPLAAAASSSRTASARSGHSDECGGALRCHTVCRTDESKVYA
jgi:hypothetical protein